MPRHTDRNSRGIPEWARALEDAFEAPLADEGENKAITLEESVRKNVKPGMALYVSNFANAATSEVIRQFRNIKPGFTIICGSRDYTAGLVCHGLAKKLIGSAFGHIYPVPGPSRAIQRAFSKGEIEIEDWTVLALIQRLMAGAMDTGCMITKSMIESSIAGEAGDSFKEIDDPFGSGQKLALVKALNPDIAIVHGWAADSQGNIITGAPHLLGGDVWGARASRGGVVATVEKIVSTDFIREHSYLVTIPGHMVNSVSEVPFGAHPQSMPAFGMGVREFETYDADYEFMSDYRVADRDSEKLDSWLKEWVIDCPTHEAYLQKLGSERLSVLKTKISKNSWKRAFKEMAKNISVDSDYSNTEKMIAAAARKITETVLKNKYKTTLTGMGASLLSAWLAYYLLREEGYSIKLMVGTGQIGYSPRPGNPQNCTMFNTLTAEMLVNSFESYGVLVGGLNNSCLSILGAGQIDKNGNINSSRTADGSYLMGSGGANDAANAEEVAVVAAQSPDRFVDRVNYVTCPGKRVKTLISDRGIFEKPGGAEEFTLVGYLANPALSKEATIRAIKESCGWELKMSHEVAEILPPTKEEIIMLRALDPQGLFRKDRAKR